MQDIKTTKPAFFSAVAAPKPAASAEAVAGRLIEKRKTRRWVILVVLFPILLILFFWFGPSLLIWGQLSFMPYSNHWQAVYLQNGQTLYGHIRGFTRHTLKLTDIYYIQSVQVGDQTTSNLVRRGSNEVTAPENFLFINRAQILYWEQIGKDAPVMKIIQQNR